ncbi:MAG: hypothetical protein WDM89_06445 [Rhizomicrobium sp.]
MEVWILTHCRRSGRQPPTVNLSGNHLGATVIAGITVPIYDAGVRDAAVNAHARMRTRQTHF